MTEACNVCLDNCREPIRIWEYMFVNFTQFTLIRLFFAVRNWLFIGRLAKFYITRHLALIYEVTTGFIMCAHEAIEIQKEQPLQKDELGVIIKELQIIINQVEDYVVNLSKTFEDIMPYAPRASAPALLLPAFSAHSQPASPTPLASAYRSR